MPNTIEFAALEKLVRPLSRNLSEELARALVEVESDQEAHECCDLLADKNAEGTLSLWRDR